MEEGGQTCFPKVANTTAAAEAAGPAGERVDVLRQELFQPGSWQDTLTRDCYSETAVYPRKGDAILFYSQTADGALDGNRTRTLPLQALGRCPPVPAC